MKLLKLIIDKESLLAAYRETMPFLGQDWRSPGWRWVKTEDGWKRCETFSHALEDGNNQLNDISHTV